MGTPTAQNIVIKGVNATFVGATGYSVLEIVVWKPSDDVAKRVPDTVITPQKVVWRAKAVLHDNQIRVQGQLSPDLFTRTPPTAEQPEAIYAIKNKDIVITLPVGVNTDTVVINIRGDAGDQSVIDWPKPDTANAPDKAGTD